MGLFQRQTLARPDNLPTTASFLLFRLNVMFGYKLGPVGLEQYVQADAQQGLVESLIAHQVPCAPLLLHRGRSFRLLNSRVYEAHH